MKRLTGFTLIEVIVVIGSIVIVLPALFGIIFLLLRQQVKIYQMAEVKRQGDYALTFIENTIRSSAMTIYNQPAGGVELCTNAGDANITVPYFRDSYGNWFRYVLNANKISSQSQIVNATADLTTTKVTVTNLIMRCSRTARFSTPIIDIQYTVTAGAGSVRTEERASMTYRTRIKLRN